MQRRHAVIAFLLLLASGFPAPRAAALWAQDSPSARPEGAGAPAVRRVPLDAAEVEAFLDGVMAAHLSEKKIAGAVVAVVRDGEVLLAKGYGYADLEKRQPVDPERTLFRIGSVSKLFTWIAVMQQVERGALDLHTDINTYLDFRIPDTFEEPITLFHLLTHTAGFEERATGLFSTSEEPRGQWLERTMPARVRAPGQFSAYSNYGTALAGYIVERVTGLSWEEYIERHILEPLGMENTTGRQPLPDHLAPQMSVGYANVGERLEPRDFEILIPIAPAGSISASAMDMARFMIANLRYGAYEGGRILEEETARAMFGRAFGHDDRLNGFGLGYYEKSANGLRIVGHGGDTQWFHTDMALIHEEDLGIFVSYNTQAGGALSFGTFLELFLDHFYPRSEPPSVAAAEPVDLERYVGLYRANRSSYTAFEKVFGLLSPPLRVAADPEAGELIFTGMLSEMRFVPLGDGVFRRVDGSAKLAFRSDENGRVTHFFLDIVPMMAMERLAWYESPRLHQALLSFSMLLFISALVLHPIRYALQRRFSEVPPLRGRERGARWLAIVVAILNVGAMIGIGVILGDPSNMLNGELKGMGFVLLLPVVAGVLTIGLAWFTIVAWRTGMWGRWGRVHYTAFTLGAIAFTWILNHWNLLGWKY